MRTPIRLLAAALAAASMLAGALPAMAATAIRPGALPAAAERAVPVAFDGGKSFGKRKFVKRHGRSFAKRRDFRRHARHDGRPGHGGGHGRHRYGLAELAYEEREPIRITPPKVSFRVAFTKAGPSGRSFYSSWLAACEALHPNLDATTGTYAAADGTRKRCE